MHQDEGVLVALDRRQGLIYRVVVLDITALEQFGRIVHERGIAWLDMDSRVLQNRHRKMENLDKIATYIFHSSALKNLMGTILHMPEVPQHTMQSNKS